MEIKTPPVDMGKPTLGEIKNYRLVLTEDEVKELSNIIKYHTPLSEGNVRLKDKILKQLENQK